MSVSAQEATDSWETIECGDAQLLTDENIPELPDAEPLWEDHLVLSRAASISVSVQTPLESTWRNIYSNGGYYEAERIVERIDDYLMNQFGIDFYVQSQPSWIASKTATSDALSDVTNTVGKGSADLMVAFAGPIADTSTSAYFGVAYLKLPYALVFDHGYTQNCKSGQHEVGHTYGLNHCAGSCVMSQGWDTSWKLFEHLCSSHRDQWNNAKNLY